VAAVMTAPSPEQTANPSTPAAAALSATDITIRFGGLTAVDNVSFTIPEGGVVSLIGPNGAGKTTFFNVLTGLYAPTSGVVRLGDRNITAMPPHKIASWGMARTFQNIRLFNLMTAEENVMVAMHSHMHSGLLSTVFGMPWQRKEEQQAREFARELLDFVGIGNTHGDYSRSPAHSHCARRCSCLTSRPLA
jgi:branched-chain amino acid transport system ATP-binding protein